MGMSVDFVPPHDELNEQATHERFASIGLDARVRQVGELESRVGQNGRGALVADTELAEVEGLVLSRDGEPTQQEGPVAV